MIEPVNSHVRSILGRLDSLGFRVVNEAAHHTILKRNEFRLTIACERYRPDIVLMTLMHEKDDSDVGEMHVADIINELAPMELARIRALDLGTKEGVRKALDLQVEFLRIFEARVFVRPAEYRSNYEANNRPDWAPPRAD